MLFQRRIVRSNSTCSMLPCWTVFFYTRCAILNYADDRFLPFYLITLILVSIYLIIRSSFLVRRMRNHYSIIWYTILRRIILSSSVFFCCIYSLFIFSFSFAAVVQYYFFSYSSQVQISSISLLFFLIRKLFISLYSLCSFSPLFPE